MHNKILNILFDNLVRYLSSAIYKNVKFLCFLNKNNISVFIQYMIGNKSRTIST